MRQLKYLFLLIITLLQAGALNAQLKKVQKIEGIPPKVQYRAITHDNTGNIYVATSADVYMIPSNSSKAQPMSAGDNIMDIDWSQDHGLIMLVKNGTIRFVSS